LESSILKNYFLKFLGQGVKVPPRASFLNIILAWVGSVIAISVIAVTSVNFSVFLLLGSFGASCVLVFGYPDSPFSQPRNVVLGHLMSTLIGLMFVSVLGYSWWVLALATATAVASMMLTRLTHPPAGSNPVIVFLAQPSWSFLVFPTAIGAMIIVVIALFFHNSTRKTRYPVFW
jgi:CBS-domain-containing membrane protein